MDRTNNLFESFHQELKSYTDNDIRTISKKIMVHDYLGFQHSSWKLAHIYEECARRKSDAHILGSIDGIEEIDRIENIGSGLPVKEPEPDYSVVKPYKQDNGIPFIDDLSFNAALADIYSDLEPNNTIVYKAKGDSMIEADIHDGDILVANAKSEARHGDIIIARLDSGSFVKRFTRYNGSVLLVSENSDYENIKLLPDSDFQIMGVVQAVYRKM